MALTPRQRQFLKGLAHPLAPVVRVGKAGASESVVAETRRSLDAHELIKVRIDADDPAQRKSIAEELSAATGSELAATIGKTAILYREREEKPDIKLPG